LLEITSTDIGPLSNFSASSISLSTGHKLYL
jgi:hypothetical protein